MAAMPMQTGLIGGVEKVQIKIVDYNADWPRRFEAHVKIITDVIGPGALRIEHIGSTSVPGLAAKPIVDILVVVANSADESTYLPHLEGAGYELRVREPGWNEHRLLRTPQKHVHIHIYSAGCKEIERYLTFRDRLRRNLEDRSRYERMKRELAAKEWADMNEYAKAKTEVIESIIASSQTDGEVSH